MPLYKVTIQRSFNVEILADNQQKASQLAEFFLGYSDESSEQERRNERFSIRTIEMLENHVMDVVEPTPNMDI